MISRVSPFIGITCALALFAAGAGAQETGMRGLNPQPDTPSKTKSKSMTVKKLKPGETQGLNPQPDPPSKTKSKSMTVKKLKPGETQGLNPQPEPPSAPGLKSMQKK